MRPYPLPLNYQLLGNYWKGGIFFSVVYSLMNPPRPPGGEKFSCVLDPLVNTSNPCGVKPCRRKVCGDVLSVHLFPSVHITFENGHKPDEYHEYEEELQM